MQFFTLQPFTLTRLRNRIWTLVAFALATGAGPAAAQGPATAYYSTGSNTAVINQPLPQVVGSGAITAGLNASDGDFATFATLRTDITANVGKEVALRLKLTGEAPAGYRAGVVLANASGLLSLNALGTVTLRTYLTGASPELREEKVVRASLVRAALLAMDMPTQLEFTTSKSFDAVEVAIDGLVGVNYATNIYYAYGVRPGIQTVAAGYLSRFAAPTASNYSTSSSSGLCVLTDVENPGYVADNDLTNFARFSSALTVGCQPAIRTKLANLPTGGTPAGHYAGFVVGQEGLLDVGVLSGLKVSTYRNGVLAESQSGTGLLELTLLPGNKAQVSFPTTKPFDEVQIERTGLITAVDNLQIYYGFGLAPATFQGINPVLSNFAAPVASTDYSASAPQTLSVLVTTGLGPLAVTTAVNVTASNVDNPLYAADADVTNYAQLNITGLGPVTNTATASLQLGINGSGRAGNRVGMVVGAGAGLLDVSALQNITLSTFDAAGVLIESKTGSALLAESVLTGTPNRSKVWFMASRNFSSVQLIVSSAASVLSNTQVYYAFAEDVPLVSLQTPLPVELTAFSGRWANGAAELSWATALEKNSRHFVVERSTGGDAAFQAVGQVAAAGNSTSPRAYKLRDAEASRQGVRTLYYRLRQVDLDGQQSFSPVVAVAVAQLLAAAPQLEIYPNPAADAQTVMVRCPRLPATGGTVLTYSQLGQLVSQLPVTEAAARLALPALAPGLYHVVLRDATGQTLATQRLILGGR